jgi:transposase InsO family protein
VDGAGTESRHPSPLAQLPNRRCHGGVEALQAAGILYSMSRKGNCWDNAPAESFFATLMVAELRHFAFNTRDEARDTVLRYICWYNAHRRHSTLCLLSPATFEAQT